jgi:hypothetical protein
MGITLRKSDHIARLQADRLSIRSYDGCPARTASDDVILDDVLCIGHHRGSDNSCSGRFGDPRRRRLDIEKNRTFQPDRLEDI